MPQTYFKIWIHLIWCTKNRQPLLKKPFRPKVLNHIKKEATSVGIRSDAINGIEDHVHCLISLNPKYAISDVVNKLKGESSHWINFNDFLAVKFAWQRGYSAFSVSESNVDRVRKYILSQEEHHKKHSFQEEVEELYKLHSINWQKRRT